MPGDFYSPEVDPDPWMPTVGNQSSGVGFLAGGRAVPIGAEVVAGLVAFQHPGSEAS